jgi:MFS family permease
VSAVRRVADAVGREGWHAIAAADLDQPLPGYARWALSVHLACPAALHVQFGTDHPRFAKRMRRAGVVGDPSQYACGLVWLGSGPVASSAGFAVLGFFLGPLFPTTMALTPQLAEPRLVPTAIGVINGVSVIGGSALPWLAGAIGQSSGISTLLPYCIGLNAVLLLLWWRTARHVPASRAEPTAENRYAPARRCG